MTKSLTFGLLVGLALGCANRSTVARDPATAAADCAQRPAHENNCNACASQPSCGWCEHPLDGKNNCQASGDASTSCREGTFKKSTNECALPPEVPPGAVE